MSEPAELTTLTALTEDEIRLLVEVLPPFINHCVISDDTSGRRKKHREKVLALEAILDKFKKQLAQSTEEAHPERGRRETRK